MAIPNEELEKQFKEECFPKTDSSMDEFSEIYEHILFHDDGDWNFGKEGIDYMPPNELVLIDWELLRKFTHLHENQEPEEPEDTIDGQRRAMKYVRDFINRKWGGCLGLPDPDNLPWDAVQELKAEFESFS